MPDPKKRVIAAIVGMALTFAFVACDSGDDPPNTTPPGDSTTAPVGS